MKIKSIIACGVLLLTVGAATTSCEDMFTAENTLVTTDLAPQDTLYQMMGIVKRMQKLADRTVLLGEIRADLVEVDPLHSTADLQELNRNEVSATNIYNQPRDYYAVINSCNIYLAHVDTMRRSQGTRKFYEKEVCAAKCFRAWCYLELLKNYGKVPFITDPVVTSDQAEDIVASDQKDDMKTILDFCIEDLKKYPYMNENNELRQNYGSTTYAGLRYGQMFIPVRALLGELYLWRGSFTDNREDYINSIRMFHDYFVFPKEEVNTENHRMRWATRQSEEPSGNYDNYFSSSNRYSAGVMPLDTAVYYGTVSDLRSVFNSQYANKYYPAVAPSQRLKDISKAQDYCLYEKQSDNTVRIEYKSHDRNDYKEAIMEGDLRLYGIYESFSNFYESQYNSDVNPMRFEIEKYGGASPDHMSYIPYFRNNILYLHMAEALNRAGFPETAFAILKYGLSYYTLNDRSIVSQREFDELCKITSYGFTLQEVKYEGEDLAKTTGTFVIWPSNVFGTYERLDASSSMGRDRTIEGGSYIQVGIHSLGSGDTDYNEHYLLDDEETLAGLKDYPEFADLGENPEDGDVAGFPEDELWPILSVPRITTQSTEDEIERRDRIVAYNEAAEAHNNTLLDAVDAYNAEYLSDPAIQAKRQARVAKLLLEEEALEGMFEGYRFYDILRYQMQDKKGGKNIGTTIALPDFVKESYGDTPNMTGKPWYLTLPAR